MVDGIDAPFRLLFQAPDEDQFERACAAFWAAHREPMRLATIAFARDKGSEDQLKEAVRTGMRAALAELERSNVIKTTRERPTHYSADLRKTIDLTDKSRLSGDGSARLTSAEWLCDLPLRQNGPLKVRLCFEVKETIRGVAVGIGFSSMLGRRILSYDTDYNNPERPVVRAGKHSVVIDADSIPLLPGRYLLDLGIRRGDSHSVDYMQAAYVIGVGDASSDLISANEGGGVLMPARSEILSYGGDNP